MLFLPVNFRGPPASHHPLGQCQRRACW